MKVFSFIILSFITLNCNAQISIDSTISLVNNIRYKHADSSLYLLNKIESQNCTEIQKGQKNELIGDILWYKGKFDSSIISYQKNIEIYSAIDSIRFCGHMYADIGYVLMELKQYAKAIEHYQKAFEIAKEYNDENLIYLSTTYKGQLNEELGYYDKALESYMEALKADVKINNKRNVAIIYNNITSIHISQKNYEKALESCEKSWSIWQKLDEEVGLAYYYGNKGIALRFLERFDEAEEYLLKSEKLNSKLKKNNVIIETYITLIDIYQFKNNKTKVKEYLGKYKNIMDGHTNINMVEDYYYSTSKYYELINEMDSAYSYLNKYLIIRDSVLDLKKQEQITMLSAQFDTDKKEYDIKLLKTEHDRDQLLIEQRNTQLYITLGGGFVFLVLLIMAYKSYRQKNQANIIISEVNEELNQTNEELAAQRDQIEEQRDDIMASITYARRIQEAILPSMDSMNKNLKNGFVLYQPKDVVAGDFYWQESVAPTGNNKSKKVYIAAADCTGHGVPGAMVSVVCSNALSKALLEDGMTDVGKILDRTREIVIDKLAKSGDVKDGMDISLACFDFTEMKLEWAGANNPLYILRHSAPNAESQIQITKGDREPIGYTDNPTPFTKHTFDLQKGDIIYLFTDGYADQFGGSEGKKLGYKLFRDLLINISDLEMSKQKNEVLSYYLNWKKDEDQVDDVCVIGIEI